MILLLWTKYGINFCGEQIVNPEGTFFTNQIYLDKRSAKNILQRTLDPLPSLASRGHKYVQGIPQKQLRIFAFHMSTRISNNSSFSKKTNSSISGLQKIPPQCGDLNHKIKTCLKRKRLREKLRPLQNTAQKWSLNFLLWWFYNSTITFD